MQTKAQEMGEQLYDIEEMGGIAIRAYMRIKNLNQAQLARRIDMDNTTVHYVLKGKNKPFSVLKRIYKIEEK